MVTACLLKREIVLVVLGEVQRSGFCRNSLAGIVLKFAALTGVLDDSALGAEIAILVQLGAFGTVCTGTGHFLSEQHCQNLVVYKS